jgi:hypothetical protein
MALNVFQKIVPFITKGVSTLNPICRFLLDIYCSEIKEEMYVFMQIIYHGRRIIICLLLPFALVPVACLPSELISNYGAYRQSVGLLGRGISPVARPIPTQEDTNTEEMRTDIDASSGMRTHNPSV